MGNFMKWFYGFVSFTIHGRNFYIGSKEKYAYTKFGFTDLFLYDVWAEAYTKSRHWVV